MRRRDPLSGHLELRGDPDMSHRTGNPRSVGSEVRGARRGAQTWVQADGRGGTYRSPALAVTGAWGSEHRVAP